MLVPYCLKLDEKLWQEIDRNRMSLVGVTNAQGMTKVDYIRDALIAYNEYFEKQVLPKVQHMNREIEEPVSIYFSDRLDESSNPPLNLIFQRNPRTLYIVAVFIIH